MKKLKPETIQNSKAKLNFETGRTVKELGEILNFRKGTYVKLEESKKGIIQIRLNGLKIANGKLLTRNGDLFVEVTELKKK